MKRGQVGDDQRKDSLPRRLWDRHAGHVRNFSGCVNTRQAAACDADDRPRAPDYSTRTWPTG